MKTLMGFVGITFFILVAQFPPLSAQLPIEEYCSRYSSNLERYAKCITGQIK